MFITLCYDSMPLITSNYASHTSSTKPNPCTNSSHSHGVHSRLQHSLVKFLNIESHYPLLHRSCENFIFFCLIGHIWPSMIKQMGSWPTHNKRVTIDRTWVIYRARRPRPHGPQPQHPCHRQIKAIISRHRRCFPRFGDISILDRPMLEIFRRQKLQYI